MLTKEEIKNLKKGQEVYIKAKFLEIGKSMNESLYVQINRTDGLGYGFEVIGQSCNIPIEDIVIPSSPKHDPTRLFKKGDRVRIKREINGRKLNHVFVHFSYDQTYTVAYDEEQKEYQSGLVKIINETGDTYTGPFYELELVTPVEELEPYKLIDSPNTYNIVRDKDMVMTIHKKSHPNA